jgi:hypothetical protein
MHCTITSKSGALLRCYLRISKGEKSCTMLYANCYTFCILLCSLCWNTHLLIQLLVVHWKSSLNHLHDVRNLRIVPARVLMMTRRVPIIPQADPNVLPQVPILQVQVPRLHGGESRFVTYVPKVPFHRSCGCDQIQRLCGGEPDARCSAWLISVLDSDEGGLPFLDHWRGSLEEEWEGHAHPHHDLGGEVGRSGGWPEFGGV